MKKDTPFLQSRYLNPIVVAVGALILSLIIAYGTDRIWSLIVKEAQRTFVVLPGLWVRAAKPLIQAAVMIVLAWALLTRLPLNRVAAIIFLASGCLIIGTYLTMTPLQKLVL
jgi:FtsH-binding integral membrane protein